MAYQSLGLGSSANDSTGDTLRAGGDKINDNFVEIYTLLGTGSALSSGISSSATVITLTAPTINGVVGGTQTSATITTLTTTTINASGVITGTTVEATADTSAGDNAAMGYTSGEGLILTGQGSTNDVTIKNDADSEVLGIPTGTTGATFKGVIRTDDATDSTSGTSGSIQTDGGIGAVKDIFTDATVNAAGDTAAGDNAAMGYTAGEGLILTGQGSTSDITLKNDADSVVFHVPTGSTGISFNDNAHIKIGTGNDLTLYHDGSNSYITNAVGALKVATETSGIAITIGHTTSVVTVADNLVVTGTATAGGNLLSQVGTQTIWVPAAAMRPTVTNGCAAITNVETTSGRPDMQVLDFDDASDEAAQFQIGFPKSWNEGTVTFRAFWTSTATDTDGVAWGLQGVSVANDATIDVAYGTAVVVTDDNISAAEDCLVTATSSAVTIASAAVDTLTFFRIFRDVSDGNDDMAEDARLIGVQIFFTTDAVNDA